MAGEEDSAREEGERVSRAVRQRGGSRHGFALRMLEDDRKLTVKKSGWSVYRGGGRPGCGVKFGMVGRGWDRMARGTGSESRIAAGGEVGRELGSDQVRECTQRRLGFRITSWVLGAGAQARTAAPAGFLALTTPGAGAVPRDKGDPIQSYSTRKILPPILHPSFNSRHGNCSRAQQYSICPARAPGRGSQTAETKRGTAVKSSCI